MHERAPAIDLWRHVIIQALDDYESDRRLLGDALAWSRMVPEPEATGDVRVDAALAALVEHLARRDGHEAPGWTRDDDRVSTQWWFVDSLPGLQASALRDSPLSFHKRGVFVGDGGLERT